MRAHIATLGLSALTLAAACAGGSEAPRADARPAALEVATAPAELREMTATYETTGTVRAVNRAVLSSKVVGTIREVRVEAGSTVEEGQVLAVIDASEIKAAHRRALAGKQQARSALAEAERQLEAARAEARLAEVTHRRYRRLLEQDAIAKQVYDQRETQHQRAQANLAMARARLGRLRSTINEAEAAADEARAMVTYTRIRAPFDGRVVDRRADPGTLASPGRPLLVVEQRGRLRVEAQVEESYVGRIGLGAPATVELGAPLGTTRGEVVEIVPTVDPGSRAFTVKVELPDDVLDRDLRSGMFARVAFPTGTTRRLLAPDRAVLERGQLTFVYVVEGERAVLRLVSAGSKYGEQREILAGLDVGERVVTAPLDKVEDGQRVALTGADGGEDD